MNHNIIIRPYGDSDQAAVAELWDSVFGPAADHNEPAAVIRAKVAQASAVAFYEAMGYAVEDRVSLGKRP